jgi:hypothetical protein
MRNGSLLFPARRLALCLGFCLGLLAPLSACSSSGYSTRGPRLESFILIAPESLRIQSSAADPLADLELMGQLTGGLEIDLGLMRNWGPPQAEQLKVLRVGSVKAAVTDADARAAGLPGFLNGSAQVSGDALEISLGGESEASELSAARPVRLSLSLPASELQEQLNALLGDSFQRGAEHLAPRALSADVSLSLQEPGASPAYGTLKLLLVRRDSEID